MKLYMWGVYSSISCSFRSLSTKVSCPYKQKQEYLSVVMSSPQTTSASSI